MTSELVTTAQAAKKLRRSQRWIQTLILRGELKGVKIANIYVVKLKDVEKYVHQGRGQPRKNSKRNGNGSDLIVRNGKKRRK